MALDNAKIQNQGHANFFKISADSALVMGTGTPLIMRETAGGVISSEMVNVDVVTAAKAGVGVLAHTANLAKLAGVDGWGPLDATQIQQRCCALVVAFLGL